MIPTYNQFDLCTVLYNVIKEIRLHITLEITTKLHKIYTFRQRGKQIAKSA